MSRAGAREGVSLVESLMGMALFVVLMAPVMDLFITANRVSFSANRLLEVTLYGQSILEAIEATDHSAFHELLDGFPPQLVPGQEFEIHSHGMDEASIPQLPQEPGSVSSSEPVDVFSILNKGPPMSYRVGVKATLHGIDGGHYGARVELTFHRLPEDPDTLYTLRLQGTVTRRRP